MKPAPEPWRTGWTPTRLALALFAGALLGLLAGLTAGGEGFSLAWRDEANLITAIRAPRSLGALAAGALLGLAGAIAQGLFRNPLADPYLLGTAAGAGLGVVAVLAAGTLLSGVSSAVANSALSMASTSSLAQATTAWLLRLGLVGAAFVGALLGVGLTMLLAGGAARPLKLLLCGVVVGVLMNALSELLLLLSPEALRGKQMFMLGSTGFLGWESVVVLGAALALALPLGMGFSRALDALVLGEASASSLGLPLPSLRLLLVAVMALATGCAVSQAGLIAFVGLVAPHLVRRCVVVRHGALMALSAAAGGVLLLAADVAARSLIAPQELPVGVLTAVLGGLYLLVLLRQGRAPG